MTDKAVAWIEFQQAMTPDKPFFVYFAPGAVHAPHHVPKEWIARWKGKFDEGWDKIRQQTIARQITLGVVPPGTRLAPKPAAIQDWDQLSSDQQHLFAHQAEVFAAYLDYTDHEIGRVRLARLSRHDERLVIGLCEPGHPVTDDDLDAMQAEEVRDELPVLPIERTEHLIGHLDHSDVEATVSTFKVQH
jgi:hypothetical protein